VFVVHFQAAWPADTDDKENVFALFLCSLWQVIFTPGGEPKMRLIPRKLFLTRGMGIHREKLTSFEMALREAGIAQFNLVRVSSIFPPGCKIIARDDGLKLLQPGEIVFAVIAEMSSNEPGRRIAASIGVARPADPDKYGYLSEHHSYGQTEQEAGDYSEDLAATMLATTLGIPFDAEKDYNERKEQYMMGGEIVDTTSITIATSAASGGMWTTVVAAAILV
jgi:arginine decarboxylase